MPFKHGRLGELWFNSVDVSNYFASADVAAKQATSDVTTFKVNGVQSTYHAYLAGLAEATLTAAGFYDSSEADKVRASLQAVVSGTTGQLTYMPAGAVAIGDQARLLNVNSSDFKNSSNIGKAVVLDWTAMSTAPVGIGTVLHVLKSENVGTVTGPGDGVLTSAQNTTGAVAHLHVTAMTGGDTHNFKLQDCTTINGVYVDIVGGAFTAVTAVGSQRLVIPGTIRQFVQAVSVISGHACTFGIAVART